MSIHNNYLGLRQTQIVSQLGVRFVSQNMIVLCESSGSQQFNRRYDQFIQCLTQGHLGPRGSVSYLRDYKPLEKCKNIAITPIYFARCKYS